MDDNKKYMIAKLEALLLYGGLWYYDTAFGLALVVTAVILAVINLGDTLLDF